MELLWVIRELIYVKELKLMTSIFVNPYQAFIIFWMILLMMLHDKPFHGNAHVLSPQPDYKHILSMGAISFIFCLFPSVHYYFCMFAIITIDLLCRCSYQEVHYKLKNGKSN